MKRTLFAFCLFFISFITFAQSELIDLYTGDLITIDNSVSIEFVEVISDSRCPVNVNCIRAGEAEVLVAIYLSGRILNEKILTFYPYGVVKELNMQLFANNNLFIRGLTLSPYPEGMQKIPAEQYRLTIGVN